jgi:hypothetical protein
MTRRCSRYSRAVMRLAAGLLVLVAAFLFAGCGESEPDVYTAEPTADCLRDHDYRVVTDPDELGVVEKNADNGGLIAFRPGNAVRIAFGTDSDDALGIERGFRRFAPKKLRPNISDVMRTQKNAVMLWTVTPPQEEQDEVFGCLKG